MSSEEVLADRLRRALYLFRSEGRDLDHADDDELVGEALPGLRATMLGFLDGKINLGTVKYRLDDVFVRTGGAFPPREAVEMLSEIMLGMDIDDLAPAMRALGTMPEDLPEAKGRMLDAEELIMRQADRGAVKRNALDRFAGLLLCLWHVQAPGMWPLLHPGLMELLRKEGLVGRGDPPGDIIDYVAACLSLSEASAAGPHLSRTVPLLDDVLPSEDECVEGSKERARSAAASGDWSAALEWWGLVIAFRPKDREALEGRIDAYLGKGLPMMAVAEGEEMVELLPLDLKAHRRLLALYKERKMIRDYNREVLRFKALMLPPPR